MALSGYLGLNTTEINSGYQDLYIYWYATQSIENNTSTITAELHWTTVAALSSSNNSKTASITIAGETFNASGLTVAISSNADRTIMTATKTVSHAADGTLGTTISGQFNIQFTLGGTYYASVYVPSTAISLNSIPRASQITSFPNFTIGSGVTIQAQRFSTSFTNTFEVKVGGTSIVSVSGQGDSYTFSAVQLDGIYATIPSSTSTTATVHVTTYSGATQIGSTQSATATAAVGSDIIPTFTSITSAETVTAVANLALGANTFVQSLSRIRFTINGAAGVKASTIAGYSISFQGVNYTVNPSTTGAINTTGSIVATATVTDSRGRTSSSRTVTCTLIAYSPPTISAFSAFRSTSGGAASPLGTYGKYTVAASISSLSSKNQLTYAIQSKLKSGSTWATHVNTSLAVGTTSLNIAPVYGTYTATSSYDLLLTVSDKFNSVTSAYVLSTGEVAMSWSKTGIGAGKVWEQGALDIGGDAYYKGALLETAFVSGAATLLGRTYSPLVTLSSASAWGDLPNGYTGFVTHTSVGAPPVSNYGYFIKIASRDMSRGWGGIWIDYSGTGNAFFGRTVDGNVAATWTRIYTSDAAVSHAHDNTSVTLSDYVSGTTPKVAGVISGTGSPPTASTVPTGTIYLKYV